jgi:hypothetical protein
MISVCTQCYKQVDHAWFAAQREAKAYPIIHECGRVLYRGTYEDE